MRILIKALIAVFMVASSQAQAMTVFACEPEWAALIKTLVPEATVRTATTHLQDPHHIEARPSLIARARSIRPIRRDSVMNGADDDGSGTVVLLEIAEKFASEKPKRSIIFISHQGEESGLLGSKWFTDHPTVPLTAIVAAHNMDMVGKGRVDQVDLLVGRKASQCRGADRDCAGAPSKGKASCHPHERHKCLPPDAVRKH